MSAVSVASFAILIKDAIAIMPDSFNTKKEIDEYYKKAMKEINDKMKEEKKTAKADAKALGVKPEPKKRVKKAKPAEIDDDGNEIVKVKKPLNKYQMFVEQQRSKATEDYPELSGEEIFTKIAELWKQHKEENASSVSVETVNAVPADIKKIDSDADKANDSGESESGNESEVDEADDTPAVVATATPSPVVVSKDKKANASGGKAPRKALSTKPAKPAKK